MNERLKLLRKELHMNQESFGMQLGVTKTAISKMELGTYSITDSMIKLICSSFNTNEVWLRTGEGEMFDTLTSDEETMCLIGQICSDSDKHKMIALQAAAKIIQNDECWRIIKEQIKKLLTD